MEKITFKTILAKIPVFIFCVLFISMYNSLFGAENSITGITILVGIFMFLQADLGFNAKHASPLLAALYILMIISTKVCFINPILGLIVNFSSMFIITSITNFNTKQTNYLPLMMGYLFCQGYDVSGELYFKRVISIVIGGILISIIYYLINKKKNYDYDIKDIFKSININSLNTQWCLKLTTSLTLVMFLGQILNYPKTMWINLVLLSLLTPSKEEHSLRKKHRIPANILGSIVFITLFVYIIPSEKQQLFVFFAGFFAMFINSYFIKNIYNSFSALVSAVVLFPASHAVLLRIISNIIGVAIVIVVEYIFDKKFNNINNKINIPQI